MRHLYWLWTECQRWAVLQQEGHLCVSALSALVLQVKVEQMALELRLTPLTVLLRSVLDQLQEKDPARIFAQPVSLKEVGVLTARPAPSTLTAGRRSPVFLSPPSSHRVLTL